MAGKSAQSARIWRIAREQEWAVARWQLAELGLGRHAIEHRVREGRLHPRHRAVYAVGRSELSTRGERIAALLACGWKRLGGPELIALSHDDAASHLGMEWHRDGPIHISLHAAVVRRQPGIQVHRRVLGPHDVITHAGIPTTSPTLTLIDLAATVGPRQLEHAINEADRLDRISPPALLASLEEQPRRAGIATLRRTLLKYALHLPTTELERLFLPIATRAGLPPPLTQQWINGYKVDFFWPDLSLIVETDSLRYHRTAAKQAEDARRDQAHAASGLSHVRFSHFQVRFASDEVAATLRRLRERLSGILNA